MDRTEECELVNRTLNGDLDAFNRLYSRHQGRIYSALFFRTRSKEDAEDLLQTTFMRGIGVFDVADADCHERMHHVSPV
jgi:RNA polymerase sigma-70 factor (ECF subfamily)